MKVITNNRKEEMFPFQHTCENCNSLLEVESETDIIYGYLGMPYVKCPVCGKRTCVSDDCDLSEDVTKYSVRFPDHFYHFSKDSGAVELSTEEIREYINDAIMFFREHPNYFCYTTGTGDTKIFVLNYSGNQEFEITVCKDFYETYIDFDNIDSNLIKEEDWKNIGCNMRGVNDEAVF